MTDNSMPKAIGMRRSFGFGDRIGLAGPGHIEAVKGSGFIPVLAQQSIRELTRTKRHENDVMEAARNAVSDSAYPGDWGADADHLQTFEDIYRMAAAGFTFFTVDPSKYVYNEADDLNLEEIKSRYFDMLSQNRFCDDLLIANYLGKIIKIGVNEIVFSELQLYRAAVKYGSALRHTRDMIGELSKIIDLNSIDIEMSVDETDSPTSPLEHLFIGLELKRLGINITSLAPRFIGAFEKGIDYIGDVSKFEANYRLHAEIAEFCGPYKLSIHSGSDKFSIYPVIGRLSREALHVKTAGTSYLEAVRVVCRHDKKLFRKMLNFALSHFEKDTATYQISTKLSDIPLNISDDDLEKIYLGQNAGRQLFHVTFGSMLTAGKTGKNDGSLFKEYILRLLHLYENDHKYFLFMHLKRHLDELNSEL